MEIALAVKPPQIDEDAMEVAEEDESLMEDASAESMETNYEADSEMDDTVID
jgi:hypothetical protein